MPLLNYTTNIDADRTAGEINKILSCAGATAIYTEYDPKSHLLASISFEMVIDGKRFRFRLPNEWKGVLAVLEEQKKHTSKIKATPEQAVRVSWRIIKDWIEAQMAFIESRQATIGQVFLPYAITRDGRTLGQIILTDPGRLLGNGE